MHDEKTKNLDGMNFKIWQQKMYFYLTTLNLKKFLFEKASKLLDNKSNFIVL